MDKWSSVHQRQHSSDILVLLAIHKSGKNVGIPHSCMAVTICGAVNTRLEDNTAWVFFAMIFTGQYRQFVFTLKVGLEAKRHGNLHETLSPWPR